MTQQAPGGATGPIEQVQTGMTVTDVDGRDVGRVEQVKMGDPEAVTTQGQDTGAASRSSVPHTWAYEEPELPSQLTDWLMRSGFVKVDARGLFRRNLYVAADQVERVADDVVHLNVPAQRLAKEHQ